MDRLARFNMGLHLQAGVISIQPLMPIQSETQTMQSRSMRCAAI
jgi:hypothetical protein